MMTDLRDQLCNLLALPAELPDLAASTFLVPDGDGPFPAVLYCHAHGGNYDLGRRELTDGAKWLSAPYASDLLRAGFAVLCVDMPGFGDRKNEGTESALTKSALWYGKPLFGQMVADQLAGFQWLADNPKVDPDRIVAFGMSMGAALAMWTAALEPRITAVAHLCMFADVGELIKSGAHDRHAPYLTVPGLLRIAEVGDIAGLIYPRPQFVAHGALDELTPVIARDAALARLRTSYGNSKALETFLSTNTGHIETPEMREAVLDFLGRVSAKPQILTRNPC